MSLDHKGVSQQGGDHHWYQAFGGQCADVTVDLCQNALKVIFFTNLTPVLVTGGDDQVVRQVVVPAGAGARHAGGENDHK
jgi:hypothetical protein